MNVLVVNAGSSSLKYQLLDTDTREVFAKGNCERIGSEMGIFGHSENGGAKQTEEVPGAERRSAAQPLPSYNYLPLTMRSTSEAIMNSSSVGTTMIVTLLSGALITISSPRMPSFFSTSIFTPVHILS